MQNIVTLGEINDALKIAAVSAAQLADMGFAALANKPICEGLPPEESRRLRNAKLYPAESIGQIRVALAQRLAAPATAPADQPTGSVSNATCHPAQTGFSVSNAETPQAAPAAVAAMASPTFMTADQGRDWAWNNVREYVGTEGWTVMDSVNFHGFFLYGWNYRGQYELQRTATRTAVMQEILSAAPAAVAVPAKLPTSDEIRAIARSVSTSSSDSPSPSEYVMAGYRAALAATLAADAPTGWKLVPMEPTAAMLERAGATDRDGTPATYKTLYMAMVGASPAAAPVVLPEPDAVISELMGLVDEWGMESHLRGAAELDAQHSEATQEEIDCAKDRASKERAAWKAIESKLRSLLAGVSAPAAVAVEKLPQSEGADYFVVLDQEAGTVEFAYTADLGRAFGHDHIKDAQERDSATAHRWVVRPAYASPQAHDDKAARMKVAAALDCEGVNFAWSYLTGAIKELVKAERELVQLKSLAQADARDAEIERAVLAERERICAAIKAEDDHCVTQGDYMLDSDDCIKVACGEWVRPVYDAAIAAAKGNGQ